MKISITQVCRKYGGKQRDRRLHHVIRDHPSDNDAAR
jgi:hypothetical protein